MPTHIDQRSLKDLTDEQLIGGCQGASPERARDFVGELAARYSERLTGFLFGFVGDASVAQDLAQEAFVRVYKHRERYKDVARFSTWLYTIGRNLALNEVRNRKHRPLLASGVGTEEVDVIGLQAASGASPADVVVQSDLSAVVRREVAALPDHQRAVVILCDLEERPYADAAEILGVPIGTVRSRLSRARSALEERLRRVL
jgi:RNA polymerase sigma-70 factor, ECF subfamily